jgi:hypothetical protein
MPAQIKSSPKTVSTVNTNNILGHSVTEIVSELPHERDRSAGARISCEIHNGIPMVRGGNSYYLFKQNGQRLLIFTRKKNQSVVVGNGIDIVVLEIRSDEVKLGITCSGNTSIRCVPDHGRTPSKPR